MRVLLLREAEAAAGTAARLAGLGHVPIPAPLTRIVALPAPDLGGDWDGILLTSPAAARCLAAHPAAERLRLLPVVAVGDRTAAAARAGGFGDVRSASGDGDDLVRLAARDFPGGGRLLHAAPLDRARDYVAELGEVGLAVATVPLYVAELVPVMPEAARDALGRGAVDAVLHYSQRAAGAYVALADAAGLIGAALAPAQLCLSARIAAPLSGAADVRIAGRPDEEALLELLGGSARLVRRSSTG